MKCVRQGVVLVPLFAISASSYAGDTNASQYMNGLLASKPSVSIATTKTRPPTQQEFADCVHKQGFPFPNIGQCAHPITEAIVSTQAATVTSSYVVGVPKLAFDQAQMTSLPTSGLLSRKRIQNCGNVQLTDSITLSVVGTQGWSLSKTHSLSTTMGVSATGSVNYAGNGGSVTFKWDQTISASDTVVESKSDTVTRIINDTLQVPAKTAVDVELFAYQAAAQVPFSAQIVIDGDIVTNQSGINKASQLLSVAERTLPFDGVLTMSEVSNSVFRTIPIIGADACSAPPPAETFTKFKIQPEQLAKIDSQFAKVSMSKQMKALSPAIQKQLSAIVKLDDDGPSIGVPDGTSYTILYSTEVVKPDLGNCGFNDIALPNPGVYNRETRQYETYVGGKLISREVKDVDTFVRCQAI